MVKTLPRKKNPNALCQTRGFLVRVFSQLLTLLLIGGHGFYKEHFSKKDQTTFSEGVFVVNILSVLQIFQTLA